jgi:hypothetical protein
MKKFVEINSDYAKNNTRDTVELNVYSNLVEQSIWREKIRKKAKLDKKVEEALDNIENMVSNDISKSRITTKKHNYAPLQP